MNIKETMQNVKSTIKAIWESPSRIKALEEENALLRSRIEELVSRTDRSFERVELDIENLSDKFGEIPDFDDIESRLDDVEWKVDDLPDFDEFVTTDNIGDAIADYVLSPDDVPEDLASRLEALEEREHSEGDPTRLQTLEERVDVLEGIADRVKSALR